MAVRITIIVVLAGLLLFVARLGLVTVCDERLQEADYYLRPYVEEVLPALASWEYEQLQPYMTDVFKAIITEEELRDELKALSRLGKLVSHKPPRLTEHKRFDSILFGSKASNVFSVSAEFELGKANIILQIRDICGNGKLNFLTVHSKALRELQKEKEYQPKGEF